MRKAIAVLMMFALVVFFYTSIQSRQPKNKEKINKKHEVQNVIHDTEKSLELGKLNNPIDIIEIHNELVNVLYGKVVTTEEVEQIVKLQRQLYAKEFLDLNTLDSQIVQTNKEIFINAEKEMKVIGSQVMNSYNDPPGTMKVQVIHYTNKQGLDLVREYIVKEQNSPEFPQEKEWKIFGWKNTEEDEIQEEEE